MDSWENLQLIGSDPCRTTIVNSRDPEQPVYIISTDETGSRPITTLGDASGNVFATLEWHLHFSDKLSVRGSEWVDVNKWLKSKKLGKEEFSFTDAEGHTYTWKHGDASSAFQLFLGDDHSTPIARYNPLTCGKKSEGTEPKNASILISEYAHKQSRDEIVLSVILMEKTSRFGGKGPFDGGWALWALVN